MDTLIYLDTHVVAWLYAGRVDLLSRKAHDLIDREGLLVSPMVALELQYLFEVGKTSEEASTVLDALRNSLGLEICRTGFHQVAANAVTLSWTRDPFDRLIVAQAAHRRASLVTRDETILENYPQAIWD